MIHWEKATKTDRRLFEAISRVLANHPHLLKFLFEPERARLRAPADLLREESKDFSSGEDLLIRVALDLWSGSGDAHIWELIEILDDENLNHVADALQFLRIKFNGWDGPVMRQ